MRDYDIVILGAGISGLSLGHYAAKRGLRTLIIEGSNQVGGTLDTHRFTGGGADFWLELGAHTCYNSYTALIGILEDLAMIDDLQPRQKVPFKMLIDNQLKSIPSQMHFLELALSVPRLFFMQRENESVESYYSRIVGKKNYAEVFRHLFDAVPSQRTNDFPADILFKKRQRRKDLLRSFTLKQGLHSVAAAIAAQAGVDVETGNAAVEIDSSAGRFISLTTNGDRYESTYLAVATPVADAASLIRPLYPELAGELSQVEVVQFTSVGVAVPKEHLTLEPVTGIVPNGDSFHSAVSRDTVLDPRYRGFTFHFKPDQLDQDIRMQRIAQALGIAPDLLERVATRTNRLPAFKLGHRDWADKIDSLLAGQKLLMTGNYFHGVSIEDCVIRSQSEAARIGS